MFCQVRSFGRIAGIVLPGSGIPLSQPEPQRESSTIRSAIRMRTRLCCLTKLLVRQGNWNDWMWFWVLHCLAMPRDRVPTALSYALTRSHFAQQSIGRSIKQVVPGKSWVRAQGSEIQLSERLQARQWLHAVRLDRCGAEYHRTPPPQAIGFTQIQPCHSRSGWP